MADINKLKDQIKSTIYPNGKGAINASDHQALLLDMADGMAETNLQISDLQGRVDKLDRGEVFIMDNTLVFRHYADATIEGETLKF